MSAGPPLVLALGVGTGSVRAHLLDTEGHRLASAGRSVPVALGAGARAKLDPEQVWVAARTVLGEALAHASPRRLAALHPQVYAGVRDTFPALAELRSTATGEQGSGGAEEPRKPEAPQSAPAPLLLSTPAARSGRSLNVYLCGMIGSGKTAIGERLAARLGRPFLDLDREMDRELGRSFHELVREEGWLAFRELEYQLCRRFARLEGIVVALGGGTVRYGWNVDVLRGTGVMVLLEADLAVLAQRVRMADRPRVNPGTSLEDDLQRIWSSACHLYRGAADLVYRTDAGKSLEVETEELLAELIARGIH